jgi:hypothetical protein
METAEERIRRSTWMRWTAASDEPVEPTYWLDFEKRYSTSLVFLTGITLGATLTILLYEDRLWFIVLYVMLFIFSMASWLGIKWKATKVKRALEQGNIADGDG